MKVLILRHTDQPAVNIVKNISMYSKYNCTIVNRDFNKLNGYDVIFYYNINDIMIDSTYNMLKNSNYKIGVGIQSWRLLFEKGWLRKFNTLSNIVAFCSPTEEILNTVTNVSAKKLLFIRTPFAPDVTLFKETESIRLTGKLRVGYVGTFREDKCYKEIIRPAFDLLDGEIDEIIIGRASGRRLSHTEMYLVYNKMDCIVCGSKYESGPMPPMEAALCGRPTITTKCGMMESVFDNTTTIFINNDYKSMYNAIKIFINDRQLCMKMGKNSKRKLTEDWKWGNLIQYQDKLFGDIYDVIN